MRSSQSGQSYGLVSGNDGAGVCDRSASPAFQLQASEPDRPLRAPSSNQNIQCKQSPLPPFQLQVTVRRCRARYLFVNMDRIGPSSPSSFLSEAQKITVAKIGPVCTRDQSCKGTRHAESRYSACAGPGLTMSIETSRAERRCFAARALSSVGLGSSIIRQMERGGRLAAIVETLEMNPKVNPKPKGHEASSLPAFRNPSYHLG